MQKTSYQQLYVLCKNVVVDIGEFCTRVKFRNRIEPKDSHWPIKSFSAEDSLSVQ